MAHEIETRWQLAPDVAATVAADQPGAVDLEWGEGRYRGRFIHSVEGDGVSPRRIEIQRAEIGGTAGWYFPRYGDAEPSAVIVVRGNAPVGAVGTWVLTIQGRSGDEAAQDEAGI